MDKLLVDGIFTGNDVFLEADEHTSKWINELAAKRPEYGQRINKYAENRPLALQKNNGKCVYCGDPANSVDHIIPRSKGGSDELDNLVPACMDCNRRKKNKLGWGRSAI